MGDAFGAAIVNHRSQKELAGLGSNKKESIAMEELDKNERSNSLQDQQTLQN